MRRLLLSIGLALIMVLSAAAPAAAAPRAGQLTVQVHAGGPMISALLQTGGTPVSLSVRLNRRDVTRLFAFRPAAAGPVVLARGDGLRAGLNRLTATALFASGVRRVLSTKFILSPALTLADAGVDRRAFGGDRVKLSAAASSAAGRGRTRYRWRIIVRPPRSRGRLAAADSSAPTLMTDRPGVYRIEVTVSRGHDRAGQDVVQVDAADPKLTRAGTFVSTTPFGAGAADGPATALRIFSGSAAGSYPVGQKSPGPVVTLMFDRSTMGLVAGPIYTGVGVGDAVTLYDAFDQAITTTGRTPLVVEAGNSYGAMNPAFASSWLLDRLNANGLTVGSSGLFGPLPTSFALAGVGTGSTQYGPPPSSMHMVKDDIYGAGRLSGQILPDAAENWAFTPSTVPAFGTTAVRFDTGTGGAIKLAGQSYPQAPPPGGCSNAGGFQVLAVGAAPPELMTPVPLTVSAAGRSFANGQTFWTSDCAASGNSADQESRIQEQGMLALLNALPVSNSAHPVLVFVQSVGKVAQTVTTPDSNYDIWVMNIADRITALGGSAGTFLSLFGGSQPSGYSFIGKTFGDYGSGGLTGPEQNVSRAEVATNLPSAPPARLIGLMRFDPAGRLIPSIATAADGQRAGEITQSLPQSDLARQMNTTTWQPTPFPGEGDPAWEAALRYLAQAANISSHDAVPCYATPGNQSDVRSSYCGGVPAGENHDTYWQQTVWPMVNGAPYVQNSTYTAQQLAAVKSQLKVEFPLVDDANEATYSLRGAFTAAQAADADSITQTYITAVEHAQKQAVLQSRPTSLGWVGEIFDLAASLTSFVTDSISDTLWVVSASLANAADLATDGTGTSTVTGLSGTLSGGPAQAAGAVQAQIANQTTTANEVRFALADAIVSDWGRLQNAAAEVTNLPDGERLANAVPAIRYAGIRYVWSDLLTSSAKLMNINDSGINAYSPTGNGLTPAYDLSFAKNYGCWLSDTGIFHDGESIEKVYRGASAGSVYSDPHNLFAWQRWDAYSPYVLTVGGVNPSGSAPSPPKPPASQYYAAFLPDAIVNPFSASEPANVSQVTPVVSNGPPGLGYGRDQFFDRLFLQSGDDVTCHGPGSL